MIIIVDKPLGWSSFQAVKKVRGVLQEKKAGHLGTLDPLATGVLPVFTGKHTKLISWFNGQDKTYRASLKLGERTETFDAEGPVTEQVDPGHLNEAQIRETAERFRGTITQLAPIYSAVKIGGKPSYQLAREGRQPERKQREVHIHRLELISFQLPWVCFEVRCSAGTYIRTLADDWGQALGVGAHLTELRRTCFGDLFPEQKAWTPDQLSDQIRENASGWAIDPVDLLPDFDTVRVTEEDLAMLRQGQAFPVYPEMLQRQSPNNEWCKAVDESHHLVSVGRVETGSHRWFFHPSKVLI